MIITICCSIVLIMCCLLCFSLLLLLEWVIGSKTFSAVSELHCTYIQLVFFQLCFQLQKSDYYALRSILGLKIWWLWGKWYLQYFVANYIVNIYWPLGFIYKMYYTHWVALKEFFWKVKGLQRLHNWNVYIVRCNSINLPYFIWT